MAEQVLLDTFTVASTTNLEDHLPEIGGAWTKQGGGVQAMTTNGRLTGNAGKYTNAAAIGNDCRVTGTPYLVVISGGSDFASVIARYDVAAGKFYEARIVDNGAGSRFVELWIRTTSGSGESQLGSSYDITGIFDNPGDTRGLTIQCVGTRISAFIDHSEVIVVTDSTIASGQAGVRTWGGFDMLDVSALTLTSSLGPPADQFVFDNFYEPVLSTALDFTHFSDIGGSWTQRASGPAFVGPTGPLIGNGAPYNTTDAPDPDYDVTGSFVFSATGDDSGVIGRWDLDAPYPDNQFYEARIGTVGGLAVAQLFLSTPFESSDVQLGSDVPLPGFQTVGATVALTLRMRGTQISVLVDGAEKIKVTDSTFTAAGCVGIRAGGGYLLDRVTAETRTAYGNGNYGAGTYGGDGDYGDYYGAATARQSYGDGTYGQGDYGSNYGESASISVNLGQVTETDTAQPMARSKRLAIGQVVETDTAQAIGRRESRALGQVAETDTPQAISRTKRRAIGQVSETDAAQAIGRVESAALGRVTESDAAQAIGRLKSGALGRVSETDTPQAIGRRKTVPTLGQVSETDAAQPIGRLKSKAIGQVNESDAAQAMTWRKTGVVGQVSETGTAQAITGRKSLAVGQVSETDTAQAIGQRKKTLVLGQVSETGTAQAIGRQKAGTLGRVAETGTAQAIGSSRRLVLGQAAETSAARPIAQLKSIVVGRVVESDIAATFTLGGGMNLDLGQVTETDTAGSITVVTTPPPYVPPPPEHRRRQLAVLSVRG